MDLKNGYKVVYEVIETRGEDKVRVFKASKTGVFADAEAVAEAKIGEYKLIYEKNGDFYGSVTGIPTDEDTRFDFDRLFKEANSESTDSHIDTKETDKNEPEKPENTVEPDNTTEPEGTVGPNAGNGDNTTE